MNPVRRGFWCAPIARRIFRSRPYLLGIGVATTHDQFLSIPDLTTTAAVQSSARAYAMAGSKPADVDLVELYDAFTINRLQ